MTKVVEDVVSLCGLRVKYAKYEIVKKKKNSKIMYMKKIIFVRNLI